MFCVFLREVQTHEFLIGRVCNLFCLEWARGDRFTHREKNRSAQENSCVVFFCGFGEELLKEREKNNQPEITPSSGLSQVGV